MLSKIFMAFFSIILFLAGCSQDGLPPKNEFINKLLPELTEAQIDKIDYTFHRTWRGYMSAAKVKLKSKESLTSFMKYPLKTTFSFDAYSRSLDQETMKALFISAICKGKSPLPAWLDLEFRQPVQLREDSTASRFRRFFISPESSVFYMIAGGETSF